MTNINLGTFDFDTASLQKNIAELQNKLAGLRTEQQSYARQNTEVQKSITALIKEQSALANSGQESSKAFSENARKLADLNTKSQQLFVSQKNLQLTTATVNKEYQLTAKTLQGFVDINGNLVSKTQLVNDALSKNNVTIAQASENNKKLVEARRHLSPLIESEKKQMDALNVKINENNNFIKTNVSDLEKQKINIGNYISGLTGAIGANTHFGSSLGGITTAVNGIKDLVPQLGAGFKDAFSQIKNASQGTEGMTKAQKALAVGTNVASGGFKAMGLAIASTGIGLIIPVILTLFGLLKGFDSIADKIEQVTAGMAGAFRFVQGAVLGFIGGIKSAGDLVGKLGNILLNPIASLKSLAGGMKEAGLAATELKKRQQALADQQELQSFNNKREEAEIARLLVMSKNRSLSEDERAKLLQKAENLNKANFESNSVIAEKGLQIARDEIAEKGKLTDLEIASLNKKGLAYAQTLRDTNRITQEELDSFIKASETKIDIFNRSTAEQEKINNRQDANFEKQKASQEKADADAKARREKQKSDNEKAEADREQKETDALNEAVALSQAQLNLFLSKQGAEAKTLDESLRLNEETLKRKLEINALELAASEKKQSDIINAEAKANEIKKEFLATQTQLVIDNAKTELDSYIAHNKSKIDSDLFFSEQSFESEKTRLANINTERLKFEVLQLANKTITQTQFNANVDAINEENRVANETLKTERDVAKTEQDTANLELKRALDQENYAFDLQAQLADEQIRYKAELLSAKKTGADTDLIKQKHADNQKAIDRAVTANKIGLASDALVSLISIMGEESKAGKALAIAKATIDTYTSAVSSYNSLSGIAIVGPVLGGIAAAAAVVAGFKNIQKITQTKTPDKSSVTNPKIPGYATGGIINDGVPISRSNGDDVMITAKMGETILNQSQARMIGSQSLANAGVPGFGSQSSLVQDSLTNNANNSQLAETIAEAVMMGSQLGTMAGSKQGLTELSDNRKIMQDAKF